MLAIFFAKYTVEVIQARELPISGTATISLLCGLLSGIFLGRTVVIWRAGRVESSRGVANSLQTTVRKHLLTRGKSSHADPIKVKTVARYVDLQRRKR